jgi:hypothetical protein
MTDDPPRRLKHSQCPRSTLVEVSSLNQVEHASSRSDRHGITTASAYSESLRRCPPTATKALAILKPLYKRRPWSLAFPKETDFRQRHQSIGAAPSTPGRVPAELKRSSRIFRFHPACTETDFLITTRLQSFNASTTDMLTCPSLSVLLSLESRQVLSAVGQGDELPDGPHWKCSQAS